MVRSDLLYEGKCKKIFRIKDHEDKVWIEFKDDLTAFNGKKKSFFKGKGQLNRDTSSLIFQYLKSLQIDSHWINDQGENAIMAWRMNMIPLEVVVRNKLAGSTAKKFQKPEGEKLTAPLFELYYKDEKLEDPFISGEQALMLGVLSSQEEEMEIKTKALKINQALVRLFSSSNMDLIDFKLEFGKDNKGLIFLGDEISADSCRIWEKETMERLDKDRFRLNLGQVEQSYYKIYQNLKEGLEKRRHQ